MSNTVHIGIDPGVSGGVAAIRGRTVLVQPLGVLTDRQAWEWLTQWRRAAGSGPAPEVFAVIEKQVPRPTGWYDAATRTHRSSVLRSTCVLYGRYMLMRGLLVASSVPYDEVDPKAWQQGLGIPSRKRSEAEADWKRRLKQRAEQLFPDIRVTLAVCDALLLAEWARRSRNS